jgi:serine/threonine-protein kinase
MEIDSAESLIQVLRASGLFGTEQFRALVRELSALGDDPTLLMRYLIHKNRVSVYQLRKVIHGKARDLFLGPYTISDKIGEGGMGKVYRATQRKSGREVALKVVRPSLLANPVIRKRWDREVRAAATLNHPNIVALYDSGEAHGRHYLAMEFVDGLDLSRLSHEFRPLEVVEACEYVRQAALGLQHAHDIGLIHRDIKPSNIVVAGERHLPQATEPAVVKILDMGLVRAVGFQEDGGPGGMDLTRAGTVVGTPDYMAPEQARNSSGVDGRADVYSLGCTLYFLLTGQPPFPEGTPIEKVIKHQLEAPTPVQALRRDVPDSVAVVLAKLLAKRPADRFSCAAEAAAALAPMAVYPVGSKEMPVRAHRPDVATPPLAADTLPPSSRSTVPPASAPGAARPEHVPAQAVAEGPEGTPPPRPSRRSRSLHARGEEGAPFYVLDDPPSAALSARSARPPSLPWVFWACVAVSTAILLVVILRALLG